MSINYGPFILTADHSWSENNGKIGLSGIFENWNFAGFPAQVMPFSIYLKFGAIVEGKHILNVELRKESCSETIFGVELEYHLPEKMDSIQLQFKTPVCMLLEPGAYELHFLLDGDEIAIHPITATLYPAGGKL